MAHRFISLRTGGGSGPPKVAEILEAEPAARISYRIIDPAQAKADIADKHLVLAIHGFNVSRDSGVNGLARFGDELKLGPHQAFFGVLWPGDFWLPFVNYPFEAEDAVKSGQFLADLLNGDFAGAASVSFISHSLGGRVLLEAVKNLKRPALEACVAAGAVDRDCLDAQYAAARANSQRLVVLSSVWDVVLTLAYPAGDFVSDVFLRDDDSAWRGALGLRGPKKPFRAPVGHDPIPKALRYGHLDYMPPGKFGATLKPDDTWRLFVPYARRCVNGEPHYWA